MAHHNKQMNLHTRIFNIYSGLSYNTDDFTHNLTIKSLLISVFLFAAWSLYLGQDTNWDLMNYHYYNPYSLFNDRLNYDLAPAQIQSYFNPALDIIPYLIIQYLPPWAFGIILGGWHGLNLWLLFLISFNVLTYSKFQKPVLWSALCALVGIIGPITIAEVGATLHDLTVSVFILASIYFYIAAWTGDKSTDKPCLNKYIICSGFFLGFGVGLKLTMAIYAIGMGLSVIIVQLFLLRRRQGIFVLIISFIFGFSLTAGPWMYVLWSNFENPFFPMFNTFFHSPYISFEDLSDKRFLPKSLTQALLFPFYFNLHDHFGCELEFKDIRIMALYILTVLFIIYKFYCSIWKHKPETPLDKINSNLMLLWFIVFIWGSYIVWLKLFSVYRYLVCVELLAPLTLALLIGNLRIHSNINVHFYFLIALFTLIVFNVHAPDFGRIKWAKSFFGVQPPQFKSKEKTLVLITSGNPVAYVIPSFPAEFKFIRIQSNFLNPDKDNYLTDQIRKILSNSWNNIYLLTDRQELNDGERIVDKYLSSSFVEIGNCEPILSRLEHSLVFCPLNITINSTKK